MKNCILNTHHLWLQKTLHGSWNVEDVGKRELLKRDNCVWYTDRYKMDTEIGMGLFEVRTGESISMNVDSLATLFQIEVATISICGQIMVQRKYQHRRISTMSDSQAVINAVRSVKSHRGISGNGDTFVHNEIALQWVSGCQSIRWNERLGLSAI